MTEPVEGKSIFLLTVAPLSSDGNPPSFESAYPDLNPDNIRRAMLSDEFALISVINERIEALRELKDLGRDIEARMGLLQKRAGIQYKENLARLIAKGFTNEEITAAGLVWAGKLIPNFDLPEATMNPYEQYCKDLVYGFKPLPLE